MNLFVKVCHGRFHDILPKEYSGTFLRLLWGKIIDYKLRCLPTIGVSKTLLLTRLIPEIKVFYANRIFATVCVFSVCWSICPSINTSNCLSVSMPVCQSVYLCVCTYISLHVYLSVCYSLSQSMKQSGQLSIYLPPCLVICKHRGFTDFARFIDFLRP